MIIKTVKTRLTVVSPRLRPPRIGFPNQSAKESEVSRIDMQKVGAAKHVNDRRQKAGWRPEPATRTPGICERACQEDMERNAPIDGLVKRQEQKQRVERI